MKRNHDQRREEITKIILNEEEVTVNDLAIRLEVTKETIRSDLAFLEEKGVLYRNHGGATLRNGSFDAPMNVRLQERMDVKKKICYEAINYIQDGDTIYIDPSSTALPLGRLLRLKKNLTIVTNCYDLIPILAQSNHMIIFAGGIYSKPGRRTEGHFVLDVIKQIMYDVCITGMDGCAMLQQPCTTSLEAMEINRCVMARSKRKILLADSTKFSKSSPYQYASFEDFDYFITDRLPEDVTISGQVTVIETERQ